MTYELIRHAVLQRRSMTATYEGRACRFSPHALGMTHADTAGLIALQYGGSRAGGLPLEGGLDLF
jgi:hypothetical protein